MKYKYWLPVILMITFIFSQSMLNGTSSSGLSMSLTSIISNLFSFIEIDDLNFIIRKMAHFTEYAILGILVIYANHKAQILSDKYMFIIILLILIPSLDETIQYFTEGRSAQISDVLLDMSGMLSAYFITSKIIKY